MSRRFSSPRARSGLIDILLLIGLCLLFFWRDLPLAGRDYRGFAAGDFADQFVAFAKYEAARLHAGELPLWSPYALSGHPFLADIQSALFYPPSLITMLLTSWSGFSYIALQLEAVLHFPLVAAGMYLLALRLLRSRPGAFVAAVAFTFGGYLTSYPILQLAILEAVAWLPWILLAIDLAVHEAARGARRRAISWALLAGLGLGVSLLAGHPQTTLLVTYAAVGFGAFRAWQAGIRGRRWLQFLALVVLAGLVAAGTAAVQLLPSLRYMQLSTRAGLGIEATGQGFTPYDLLQLLIPAVGTPVPALYVGMPALALALFAVLHAMRSRLRTGSDQLSVFLAGGGILGLLLSFGSLTPLYQLFFLLAPGWSLFRRQERLALWVVLALALLAGQGMTIILAHKRADEAGGGRAGSAVGHGLLVASGAAFLTAMVFFVVYQGGISAAWGFVAALLFTALILVLSAAALYSRQPLLIIAVIVIDLFTMVGGNHAGTSSTADPYLPNPYLAVPLADNSAFRIANEKGLPAHFGYGWGLEEIGGASPLKLSRYGRFVDTVPPARTWQLLNVKYVSTGRNSLETPADPVARAEAAGENGAVLHRLREPAPRAWLTGNVTVERDEAKQLEILARPEFQAQGQVVLEEVPQVQPVAGCGGTVAWQERRPERLVLNVAATDSCVLVVSEIFYPGWRLQVDGRDVALLRADSILRAVALQAGAHTVTMTFSEPLLPAGAVISSLSLLLVLAWLVFAARRRGRSSP